MPVRWSRNPSSGFDLLNIGPTTSIRMEPHSDFLGRLGVKAIVGKGGLAEGSVQAFKKYGMVYLLAAPGCGVLHAQAVKQVKRVHWLEEMGMPEAIWVLGSAGMGSLDCGHGQPGEQHLPGHQRGRAEEAGSAW